jgi:hypothetical protein
MVFCFSLLSGCLSRDNDLPTAVDDTATTTVDTAVTIAVLSNDTDPNQDRLTVIAVAPGNNGTTTTDRTTVVYTPEANFSGTDTFTYTIGDGHGGTDTAMVSVTVIGAGAATAITVSGRVLFDTGDPVAGATITASVLADSSVTAALAARRASQVDMTAATAQGDKPTLAPHTTRAALAVTRQMEMVSDTNGNFAVTVSAVVLPARVLLEVRFPGPPPVQSARVVEASAGTPDAVTLTIPATAGSEVVLQNGAGQTQDGTVRIEGMPAEVTSLFARSYDPNTTPEAFPGEFRELGSVPLNSSVFAWIEALDANSNVVTNLSQMATIRVQIAPTQWADLEDITTGTDRIELPIYLFNEDLNMWEQRPEVGWIEDERGTVLPEDAQSVILDGSFQGNLFATFPTNHLTWFNVDYAFLGPWTLSRLDPDRRNNSCLFRALLLARTIALSAQGRQAYARVNQDSADIAAELADGQGPELKNSSDESLRTPEGDVVWGQYTGDSGGSETQFEMNNTIWDSCGNGASQDQQRNTTLRMTVNILHETAHWKDDVKKFPSGLFGEPTPSDTPGEEGTQLEHDLFGGDVDQDDAGNPILDGNPVDDTTRDRWLDPTSWPPPAAGANLVADLRQTQQQEEASPLQVTITTAQDTFDLGSEIPLQVTYENISNAPIQVMNRVVLEGYPLYMDIINQETGARVAFLGTEQELQLTNAYFTQLAPGETLSLSVNLLRHTLTGTPLYQLINPGTYDVTAVYEARRGVPLTRSNTLVVTLTAGGSLSGTITNASTGMPLPGATVRLFQGQSVLTTVTADAQGTYSVPGLPPGIYTLEARASGFLRNTQGNIDIVRGQNTEVNFSLSPLLSAGSLRLVLTWGETPRDLDSHLWLPVDRPYHVAYFRRGDVENCPFAELDVDDTSGAGPETITISQRFPGTYLYAIHNFSGSPALSTSQARVQVFDASGLVATFNVPTEGAGLWWSVFTLDGVSGQITEINTLGDDPAPYGDTDMGCTGETPQ